MHHHSTIFPLDIHQLDFIIVLAAFAWFVWRYRKQLL